MSDEEQLELPLTNGRRPPVAASRKCTAQTRNVQQALAALKTAKVRKEQQIPQTVQAIQSIKRTRSTDRS